LTENLLLEPFLISLPRQEAKMSAPQEDLDPEQTEGFKVGEKKTIDEYQQLGRSTHRDLVVR
jgi:hypothetical protein